MEDFDVFGRSTDELKKCILYIFEVRHTTSKITYLSDSMLLTDRSFMMKYLSLFFETQDLGLIESFMIKPSVLFNFLGHMQEE